MSCDIKIGSTGNNVINLQTILFKLGYYHGKIDGQYGPVTTTAVKAYQKKYSLTQDGYAGPITTAKMGLNCTGSAPATKPGPTSTTIPDALKPFLQPTKNCQSNDSMIIALANKIVYGITDPLAKAKAIFNYVRDKYGYSFYYNTKLGAIGMLTAKAGNCTDDAHLLNALYRAAGLPARYRHIKARFTSGDYGHTISEVYVNGTWYDADATNDANVFGSVVWKLLEDYGTFAELPY